MKNKLLKVLLTTSIVNISLFSYDGFVRQTSNIREFPTVKSKVVNVVYKNNKIDIIKKVYTKNNGTWLKTTKGYIARDLIDFTKIINTNPYYVDVRKLKVKPSGTYIDKKTGLVYTEIFIPSKPKNKPIKEINLDKKVSSNTNTIKTNSNKIINTSNSKYFLGASVGFSHLDTSYNKINGAFSPVGSTDKNGYNFGWEIGYHIDENSFTTLSYNQINLDDAKLYNYLISYNRRLQQVPYNTYVGILGGISYIKTTKSPIPNLDNTDAKGRTTTLGIQFGAEYKIQKDLNFFAQYQFLKAKHTTHLVSYNANASLERDDFSNIMFGVRWSFNSQQF